MEVLATVSMMIYTNEFMHISSLFKLFKSFSTIQSSEYSYRIGYIHGTCFCFTFFVTRLVPFSLSCNSYI